MPEPPDPRRFPRVGDPVVPVPRRRTPDEPPGLRDAVEAHVLGEHARGLAARKKLVLLLVMAATAALAMVAAAVLSVATGLWTAKPTIEAQQDANREIDAEKAPFTASIEYDENTQGAWIFVLGRTFTEKEQDALNAIAFEDSSGLLYGERLLRFLQPLGGRFLARSSYMDKGWPTWRMGAGYDATVFRMNLYSERAGQLSITGMEAVDLDCEPSRAETIVDFAPQGAAPYEGVLFDLSAGGSGPYITDPEPLENQGLPYFDVRRIDLGAGASPGGLRVEALVDGESCRWGILAHFVDASNKRGEVALLDEGEPFFAEAAPTDPVQHWIADVGRAVEGKPPLAPCHEDPGASGMCP
ncbi:hypothetical protein AB0I28_29595 [Phytomonospora sp. NPDC050363]|uniref:hypothetical protein n=1 Tax=Phytomonospora sp. NPDC050363 TaxID=3155642 RepID=UPI0033E71080